MSHKNIRFLKIQYSSTVQKYHKYCSQWSMITYIDRMFTKINAIQILIDWWIGNELKHFTDHLEALLWIYNYTALVLALVSARTRMMLKWYIIVVNHHHLWHHCLEKPDGQIGNPAYLDPPYNVPSPACYYITTLSLKRCQDILFWHTSSQIELGVVM